MNAYRLYIHFTNPETRKDQTDFVRFGTYEEAEKAARALEAQIAEAPTSRKIVEISANGQRVSFFASSFQRTKILSENEDPKVPSMRIV